MSTSYRVKKKIVETKKKTPKYPDEGVLGVVIEQDGVLVFQPTDKRIRECFDFKEGADVKKNALLLVQVERGEVQSILKTVAAGEERTLSPSTIAIHSYDIPSVFPKEVISEAERVATQDITLGKREDLRDYPLITIDGEDSRDFDDAVWAAPDDNPQNAGGFHLLVAIADVAFYVARGSALDKEAQKRGNSAYFPDRVIPMLPEKLSNDLCSLRPDEDRPCLAVHMWINRTGKVIKSRFVRGIMRSHERCTYKEVEADRTKFANLYGAYAALHHARTARGTLDFDFPERQIVMNDAGEVSDLQTKERLDAHRLIEEFMVTANVAAAKFIAKKGLTSIHRRHDSPPSEDLYELRKFLETLRIKFPKEKNVMPIHFSKVLEQAKGETLEALVNQLVLRAQSRACYTPDMPEKGELGHFGLSLSMYTHFTSPIRRYADLIVHRLIVMALGSGSGQEKEYDEDDLQSIAEHISQTERRASSAERDSADRYVASYMESKVGDTFKGRITGVSRFGMFVAVDRIEAEGLVTLRSMEDDRYFFDQKNHQFIGIRTKKRYQIGKRIEIELVEANAVTGAMRFQLVGDQKQGENKSNRRSYKKKNHKYKKNQKKPSKTKDA
ncbi:MAG: ribonuclease R [Alphaproteobacteria bacterium]